MIKACRISRWSLLLLTLLLCACTTPSEKPPGPKPMVSDQASSARSLDELSGAAPGGAQAAGEGGQGSPGSAQGYGAASANAAEVEEEEVAADGTTRMISSSRPAPATTAAGGGALPPSSATPQRAGGSGGGGPKADVRGPGTRYTDMHGVDIEGRQSTDESAGESTADDMGAEALRAGKPDGHSGGRGQRAAHLTPTSASASAATRFGVRGGIDESGATLGTPAAAPIPPPGRTPAAARDNDILAQQLREAAEQEKDPVLREKLWAEYRKYKVGL